jgi:alginate O-acetyltransferase complex protein AlgI
MLFSSPDFFLFFAAYFLVHLALPARYRVPLIITGSTIFYGQWNLNYVWIPHALMLLAYVGARWVEQARGTIRHRRRLAVVVTLLLLPLGFVKYANFIYADVLGALIGWEGRISEFPLPLGISFITFTMIAYVVDVYRGKFPLERSVARLTGLVLFFPHLIAGPILRPHDLLPQLAHPHPARRALRIRVIYGLAIFSIGLLKKLVFADPMAAFVDEVYVANADGVVRLTSAQYLLAIYGFSLQIYCDFSGYTDMAIGLAILLGMRLPTNFVHPYTAASIVEFWRRWHITLSTWLRDYLYVPLGGNRLGRPRQISNVMITMVLGGLWHGANWTFVVWGFSHGTGIAAAHAWRWRRRASPRIVRAPRWLLTLVTFHFVTIAWIFFRAPDLGAAWRVMRGPFTAPSEPAAMFIGAHVFPLFLLAVFFLTHRWDSHRSIRGAVHRLPQSVYWPIILLIWMLAITVSAGSSAKFIYFDF